MDYERIKSDKIQEATELFNKLGIEIQEEYVSESDYTPFIAKFQNKGDPNKETEFHWTRLSINSNIGCIVD